MKETEPSWDSASSFPSCAGVPWTQKFSLLSQASWIPLCAIPHHTPHLRSTKPSAAAAAASSTPFFVLFLFFKRERGDPVKSRFSPKWVSVPVYFHAQGNMSLRYPWKRHTELTSTGILCSNYAQVIPFTWNVVVRSGVSRTQKSSLSVCAENPELSKVLFSSL